MMPLYAVLWRERTVQIRAFEHLEADYAAQRRPI